ncbi:MAG: hypothetical protein IPJ79_10015 [Bacteroidetes bacterium]|nr:hypothetical protein [Bacteroidota bacterium]HNR21130.1 hypothetical protein [Bacteroidia bacterium]HNU34647.1 hypothetical protein [Bacteroidia bacterium]
MRDKLDNLITGLLFGSSAIYLLYLLFEKGIYIMLHNNGKGYLLFPPRLQLCILVIMVITMRLFMINLKMHKFGKGWLASVFIAALLYFYFVKDQFIK